MANAVESELIARFKAGDIAAFNLLTRRWYEKIMGFLYRVLGNIEDAEDACQKTFMAVYTRIHQLSDNDRFTTWLYQIANNNAMDQIRDRKRLLRRDGSPDDEEYSQSDDPPDPETVTMETSVDTEALSRIFEEAMQTIPDEQRTVIVMKLYEGLKFTEIAQILDITANTVKSRMYSGLRAMKGVLDKNKFIKEMLRNAM